jgi:maleamate amidohydrolase
VDGRSSSRALESLLEGLPSDAATAYRQMWERQPPWGIGRRSAIVVVDMTRGFLDDRFPLGQTRSMIYAEATRRLLDAARPLGIPVIYTLPEGDLPTEPEHGAWLRGMSLDEYGIGSAPGEQEIPEPISPQAGDVVIVKPKPSAFFGTQLHSILRYHGVDTVVVAGMGTGRCVRATVDDAFAFNYRVIIPVECVGGGIELSRKVELLDMGVHIEVMADLVTVDELIEALRAQATDRKPASL